MSHGTDPRARNEYRQHIRSTCWSWEHLAEDPQPALAGTRTCVDHAHEEPSIRRTIAELLEVKRAIDKAAELGTRGGDIYKAMVEGAVKTFLLQGLEGTFRTGTGFHTASAAEHRWHELDIVVDALDVPGWYGDARLFDEGPAPFAHLEVALRTRHDNCKAPTDFARLKRSVTRAVERHTKIWTGSVLCGSSWTARRIATALHNTFMDDVPLVEPEELTGAWWPAIDIVAAPAFAWTKTDARGPARDLMLWMLTPIHEGDCRDPVATLRPLALAREKLRNFLQLRIEGRLLNRRLSAEPSATWGPPVGRERLPLLGSPPRRGRLVAVSPGSAVILACEWWSKSRCHSLRREFTDDARPWEWFLPEP